MGDLDQIRDLVSKLPKIPTIDEYIDQQLDEYEQNLYKILLRLRYSTSETFPVDFESLHPKLFSRKDAAKRKLVENFQEDVDYVVLHIDMERPLGGGQNKEDIFLTLKCAQGLALHSNHNEGPRIKDFFIKAVECLSNYHMMSILFQSKEEIAIAREKALLQSFPDGVRVNYIGHIGNSVYKFGWTDSLWKRVHTHKLHYGQFTLMYVLPHTFNREVEKQFANDPLISIRKRVITINNVQHKELICIDSTFTFEDSVNIMKNIGKRITVESSKGQEVQISELVEKVKMLEFEDKEKVKKLEIQLQIEQVRLESKRLDVELAKLQYKPSDVKSIQELNESSNDDDTNSSEENRPYQGVSNAYMAKYWEDRGIRTYKHEYFSIQDILVNVNEMKEATARTKLCMWRKDNSERYAAMDVQTIAFPGVSQGNVQCVHISKMKECLAIAAHNPNAKKLYRKWFVKP